MVKFRYVIARTVAGAMMVVAASSASASASATEQSARGDTVVDADSPVSTFVGIGPVRIADTRPNANFGFVRVDPGRISIKVDAKVAGTLTEPVAAVINLTSTDAAGAGYATAYAAGRQIPLTSSINTDRVGQIVSNLVTVPIGDAASIEVFASVTMNVVADLVGVYVPVSGRSRSGRFIAITGGATRVLDTRNGFRIAAGGTQFVDLSSLSLPDDATAVVANLTSLDADAGYWTAYPTSVDRPASSSLNIDHDGQVQNSQSIVQLSPHSHGFDVYSQSGGQLVVDIVGWYTGPSSEESSDGLFVPANPTRSLDTRDTFASSPAAQTTVGVMPVPDNVAAVDGNVTVTGTLGAGFVTTYPAGQIRPLASALNVSGAGQTSANHAIVTVGDSGLLLFTQTGAQMVFDVDGWFVGKPIARVLSPCAGSNLQVAAKQTGDPVGVSQGVEIDIVNIGSYACTLDGYPQLAIENGDGKITPVSFQHGTFFGSPPLAAPIAPAQRAVFVLAGQTVCNGETLVPAVTTSFELVAPGGGVSPFTVALNLQCGTSVSQFGQYPSAS